MRVLRARRAPGRSPPHPSEAHVARAQGTYGAILGGLTPSYDPVSLEVEELVGHLFGGERVEYDHDPPCEFEV